MFNPPYVPTPDEEVGSNGIEASWAGGRNGRVVLDKALPQIAQLLAYPHGVAYIVVVDDNYPEQLSQMMAETYHITSVPWMRRRARNEFLTILKMTPTRKFCSDGKT
jgi:release factor glutamine methyltransferase